jgi:FkbM family methyltransferase
MPRLGQRLFGDQFKSFLDKMGYQLVRKNLEEAAPFEDMQHFLPASASPVIFDVGANFGQTVERILSHYPHAVVHAFEPSPASFQTLASNCANRPSVKAWNLGVGASESLLTFNENEHSQLSSFLEPLNVCGGETKRKTEVAVTSLDAFCDKQSIDKIDILKLDTQGFELPIFQGAERLMREHRIGFIFFELIVSEHYSGLPPYWELLRFLDERGYKMASFYPPHFHEHLVSWTNFLYLDPLALAGVHSG